jgi:DNA-directed RNA polymerase I, II, and III subunit RPABC2
MSESDIELDYDDNLDPDIYLDEDNEDKINKKSFIPNKNKSELDNDDNNNDYINDNEEDEDPDPDEVDDNYDDYDKLDNEFEEEIDEDYNYNEDNIHYIDNELDNDSKIQYIIKSDDRITSNILTIYEITELMGIRATQISQGAPVFTDIKNITNPIKMAEKELIDNRCPLYVKRYIGLDKYELWDPNTMIKPKL